MTTECQPHKCGDFRPTDDEARKVHEVLIGASWADPDAFAVMRKAWQLLGCDWGIIYIKDNGHGHVIREAGR